MSDNTTITAGTGTTIATDLIGGVHIPRTKLVHGADGVNDGDVSSANPLPATVAGISGVVSTGNSTTTALAAFATFTGTSMDVRDHAHVIVSAFASHDSAADGLKVQFSSNGTDWDSTAFAMRHRQGSSDYHIPVSGRYLRVLYQNGPTLQTAFRLQTIVRPTLYAPDPVVGPELPQGVIPPYGSFRRELWDDFERPDTAVASQWALGTAPSGHVWLASGPGFASTQITSGRFNAGAVNRTIYLYQFLSSPVRRIGGVINYGPGGGGTGGGCIFITGKSISIASWVHFQANFNGWGLDVITESGTFINLVGGSYTLLPDTPYYVAMTIDGNTAYLELPDGSFTSFTDARIGRFSGQMAMYEIYSVATTDRLPRFERVFADTRMLPGGVGQADKSAFIEGQSVGVPMGGVFNDAVALDLSPGNFAAARMTSKRALHVAIADNFPQKLTYRAVGRSIVGTAPGAINSARQMMAIWHAATVTKSIYIRQIIVTVTTTAATVLSIEVVRITTAPVGGTVVTPVVVDPADVAATSSVVTLPTTAGTASAPLVSQSFNVGASVATTNPAMLLPIMLYQFQAGNDAKPLRARASTLEGYAIQFFTTANVAATMTIEVEFSED